jgi:plastocyanin
MTPRWPLPFLLAAHLATGVLPDAGRPVAAGAARTGTIRGRVEVSDTPRPSVRPSVADLAPMRRDPVDRRTAVVFLDSAPRQAFDELRPGRARMDQRHEQFVPRVLAVTVGTVVDFPNSDTTFHNVFSLSHVRTFDLGRYPPGRTGAVRFDRPGIVPISCDIHSHMSAYVLVFSHPFFAVAAPDGQYLIRGVPPGVYTVRVWSELGEATPQRVTVPDGGSAEADFRVGGAP